MSSCYDLVIVDLKQAELTCPDHQEIVGLIDVARCLLSTVSWLFDVLPYLELVDHEDEVVH